MGKSYTFYTQGTINGHSEMLRQADIYLKTSWKETEPRDF
jgi:hypothetical protein